MSSAQFQTKNSCIMHPKEDYWVRLYCSYLTICKDSRAGAFLLHWLEYATNRLPDEADGWVVISCRDLAEQSMGLASAPEICRQAGLLVNRGLIEKRAGGPPGSHRPTCYRIVIDKLQEDVYLMSGVPIPSVSPRNGETNPPFRHETDSVSPRNGERDFDSSLSIKGNLRENPPTPLSVSKPEPSHPIPEMPMEIGAVRWTEQEAQRHGLSVRFNSANKRSAVEAADSPLWREKVSHRLAELAAAGVTGNVTGEILKLADSFCKRQRSGFVAATAPTPPARAPSRSLPPKARESAGKEKPPPTAFAARITELVRPYTAEQVHPAVWIWQALERQAALVKTFDADIRRYAEGHPGMSLGALIDLYRVEHCETRKQKTDRESEAIERYKREFLAD